MRYILISLAQTTGVILLAGFGIFLGRWISRQRSRVWLAGYAVPLLLVLIIAVPCRTIYCRNVHELHGKEPLIAVVKFSYMVDHYVAVLSVTDTDVILGDPLLGLRTCTHKEFEEKWRKCVIVIEKNPER